MKVFLVVVALCIASTLGNYTAEQKAEVLAHVNICIAETGLDPVVLENAKNGQIAENDEKFDCFATCILKRVGVINAEGNIDEEVSLAKAPTDLSREQVVELLNECKVLRGNNDCETGGMMFRCFAKSKSFIIV